MDKIDQITVSGHTFAIAEGSVYPLTACCKASGKGSSVESGVVCRKCYHEVATYYGGFARDEKEFVYMTYDVLPEFVAQAVWQQRIVPALAAK